MFVDGNCESSGKNVGSNSLDGLSLGCDHTGVFFLTGMIAELRLYNCHMPAAQRVQTEAALARRYALDYTDVPAPPPARAEAWLVSPAACRATARARPRVPPPLRRVRGGHPVR